MQRRHDDIHLISAAVAAEGTADAGRHLSKVKCLCDAVDVGRGTEGIRWRGMRPFAVVEGGQRLQCVDVRANLLVCSFSAGSGVALGRRRDGVDQICQRLAVDVTPGEQTRTGITTLFAQVAEIRPRDGVESLPNAHGQDTTSRQWYRLRAGPRPDDAEVSNTLASVKLARIHTKRTHPCFDVAAEGISQPVDVDYFQSIPGLLQCPKKEDLSCCWSC
mmetsp:Transcript_10641/g.30757  ORF Transcript_10641/g.30757 Transcript_10641/m.30757 type:complete len:218 (+) Transcript_10641:498-1151(+)